MTSPLPAPLRPLAPALEALYRVGLGHRTRAFDRGKGVVTIDRPVISVGNLSVGGTGKSPTVAFLVQALSDAGHTPAIAMRGYRASNGLSDEADAYTRAFPEIPVIAQADRLLGLLQHFGSERGERTDVVVLDDGFQHRRIARQLDIVLIDATRSPFNDRLLPAGYLREPPSTLARATCVVLTHCDRVDASTRNALASRALDAGAPVIARSRHAWSALDVFSANDDESHPTDWLKGRRLAVVTAIGKPDSVIQTATAAAGAPPSAVLNLKDHDPYAPGTLAKIERLITDHSADTLLVTDKDWSKLRARNPERFGVPIARPRLGLGFLEGEDRLRGLIAEAAARDPDDGPIILDGPIH
ncbi:MAG: tetraacyldisaccharide 4'-kinase [Planctomycetota bacterium]